MIRLIITDDHPVIRDGIKAILDKEKDISLIAEVSSGNELLEILLSTTPDVILMGQGTSHVFNPAIGSYIVGDGSSVSDSVNWHVKENIEP